GADRQLRSDRVRTTTPAPRRARPTAARAASKPVEMSWSVSAARAAAGSSDVAALSSAGWLGGAVVAVAVSSAGPSSGWSVAARYSGTPETSPTSAVVTVNGIEGRTSLFEVRLTATQ